MKLRGVRRRRRMIIKLPNGEERELCNNLPIEEKKELCQELVEEFDEYINTSWGKHSVSYFLTGLANYLCWHKDEGNYRDKEKGILSNSREKQMDRKRYHGRWRKDTLFSDLNSGDEMTIFGEMNEYEE